MATNKETPVAEIPKDSDTMVELSHEYLCERWCSVFRLMKIVFRLPNAFEQFERESSFGQDTPFEWPWDVPTPDTSGNHVVDAAYRYVLPVVSATILHEIGHVFARTTAQSGCEAEMQADAFAMEYLLGDEKPTRGFEMRTVGVYSGYVRSVLSRSATPRLAPHIPARWIVRPHSWRITSIPTGLRRLRSWNRRKGSLRCTCTISRSCDAARRSSTRWTNFAAATQAILE